MVSGVASCFIAGTDRIFPRTEPKNLSYNDCDCWKYQSAKTDDYSCEYRRGWGAKGCTECAGFLYQYAGSEWSGIFGNICLL